jgi:hypothetical protein
MRFLRSLLVIITVLYPIHAQTIGGGTCTKSTLNGTFFYLLGGTVVSQGVGYAYAELGKLIADGNGNVSGHSESSLGGSLTSYTLTGTYTVQENCSAAMALSVDGQAAVPVTIQITNGGLAAVLALSNSSEVVAGRAYRQTAQAGSIHCGNGSLSGAHGHLLEGVTYSSGSAILFSETGSVVSDGAGNLTSVNVVNLGGTIADFPATGSYSIASDCSGTAQINDQFGTTNYVLAVVLDGQNTLFMEIDSGTTIAGTAQPAFAAPQQAIVNAASFTPGALSPGALISIFGNGLSQQTASAAAIPLPATLGSAQVLVNGEVAPLLYVSPSQINAQLPLDVSTVQPVSLSVTNGATRGNTVTLNVSPAAVGIFENGENQAIVQNSDYSVNTASNPAHPGDVVVAYLTGGGLSGEFQSAKLGSGGVSSYDYSQWGPQQCSCDLRRALRCPRWAPGLHFA